MTARDSGAESPYGRQAASPTPQRGKHAGPRRGSSRTEERCRRKWTISSFAKSSVVTPGGAALGFEGNDSIEGGENDLLSRLRVGSMPLQGTAPCARAESPGSPVPHCSSRPVTRYSSGSWAFCGSRRKTRGQLVRGCRWPAPSCTWRTSAARASRHAVALTIFSSSSARRAVTHSSPSTRRSFS